MMMMMMIVMPAQSSWKFSSHHQRLGVGIYMHIYNMQKVTGAAMTILGTAATWHPDLCRSDNNKVLILSVREWGLSVSHHIHTALGPTPLRMSA
jgi:hypothetical protein